jgi:hypothetical protein
MTVGRIPSVEGGIQPTIVDAKGDLIAAVAADSLNRLAVGSNDQVLVADSAASTGLAWKSYGAQVTAGKNAVINGGMDIWQRGTTSASITTAATYTTDRWASVSGASTAMTVSRQVTGDTTNLPNIQYCSRVQKTAGQTGTSVLYFAQSIESVNSIPFAGKTVTLSFYARKGANYSQATSIVSAYLQTGTGTDQNILSGGLTGAVNAIAQDATLTTTWQRFSYTATLGATITQIGMFFAYTPVGTAGANDWFEITGVQLEVGSVATPFSRAGGTIQGELAACQRYYYRTNPLTQAYADIVQGQAATTTDVRFILRMPTTMRTTPIAVEYATLRCSDYTNNLTVSSINGSLATPDSVELQAAVTGAIQFRPYILQGNNSTSAYVAVSAEL